METSTKKTKKVKEGTFFDRWKAWLYLLPAIILLLIFTGWPIVNTIRIAFLEGYDADEDVKEDIAHRNVEKLFKLPE